MTRRPLYLAAALAIIGGILLWHGTAMATNYPSCLKRHPTAYCDHKYGHTSTTVATTVPVPSTTVSMGSTAPSPSLAPTTLWASLESTAGTGAPSSVLARVELPASGGSPAPIIWAGVAFLACGVLVLIARRRSDA